MKRIKHNDLTHYFIRDHKDLPPAYLRSCEKFFKELSLKHQAPSAKRQAPRPALMLPQLNDIEKIERNNYEIKKTNQKNK